MCVRARACVWCKGWCVHSSVLRADRLMVVAGLSSSFFVFSLQGNRFIPGAGDIGRAAGVDVRLLVELLLVALVLQVVPTLQVDLILVVKLLVVVVLQVVQSSGC